MSVGRWLALRLGGGGPTTRSRSRFRPRSRSARIVAAESVPALPPTCTRPSHYYKFSSLFVVAIRITIVSIVAIAIPRESPNKHVNRRPAINHVTAATGKTKPKAKKSARRPAPVFPVARARGTRMILFGGVTGGYRSQS